MPNDILGLLVVANADCGILWACSESIVLAGGRGHGTHGLAGWEDPNA